MRGTAISIYYFGIYIGYSLAFAIGNGIEKVLNWRWVFFISALAGKVILSFPGILFNLSLFSILPSIFFIYSSFHTKPLCIPLSLPSPPFFTSPFSSPCLLLLPHPSLPLSSIFPSSFSSSSSGIAVVPFVLFTIKEPKRKKNPVSDQAAGEKLPIGSRILLLLKTFIMPGMLTLCIAGGIRNAGGYVWAYNTELFFEKSGFSDDHIRNYMSWIPLVAGSIGAIVGGIISDVLVKGRGPYMRIWVLIISQVHSPDFLPQYFCMMLQKSGHHHYA